MEGLSERREGREEPEEGKSLVGGFHAIRSRGGSEGYTAGTRPYSVSMQCMWVLCMYPRGSPAIHLALSHPMAPSEGGVKWQYPAPCKISLPTR